MGQSTDSSLKAKMSEYSDMIINTGGFTTNGLELQNSKRELEEAKKQGNTALVAELEAKIAELQNEVNSFVDKDGNPAGASEGATDDSGNADSTSAKKESLSINYATYVNVLSNPQYAIDKTLQGEEKVEDKEEVEKDSNSKEEK